jgi:putative ABC transport system substrate-binding protein
VTIPTVELAAKLLDVLRELLPKAGAVGLLVDPANPIAEACARATREAAQATGLRLHVLNASTAGEIDGAFAALGEARLEGLVVAADPFSRSGVAN